MPVDEQAILGKGLPTILIEDRACVGCGYNLKGLRTDGKCPECGRPIRKASSRLSKQDDMTHAPLPWLRAFSASAQSAFWGYLLLLGLWIACAFVGSRVPVIWGVLGLPGLLFVWGVLGLTKPRPVMKSTVVSPAREWRVRRVAARVCALGWLVWAGGLAGRAMIASPSFSHAAAGWMSLAGFAMAIAGLSVLLAYLSEIADWANDITLVFKLRAAVWIVSAGGLAFFFAQVILRTGVGIIEALLLAFCVLLACAGTVVTIVSLSRVASLANWAVINHMTDRARSERLREKAERARFVEEQIATAASSRRPGDDTHAGSRVRRPGAEGSSDRAAAASNPRPTTGGSAREGDGGGGDGSDGIYALAPEDEPPTPPRA